MNKILLIQYNKRDDKDLPFLDLPHEQKASKIREEEKSKNNRQ